MGTRRVCKPPGSGQRAYKSRPYTIHWFGEIMLFMHVLPHMV